MGDGMFVVMVEKGAIKRVWVVVKCFFCLSGLILIIWCVGKSGLLWINLVRGCAGNAGSGHFCCYLFFLDFVIFR